MILPLTKEAKTALSVSIQGCINAYNKKEMGVVDHSIYDTYRYFSVQTKVDDILFDRTRSVEGIIARRGDALLIIFQGSNGFSDWIDNFHFFKESEKYRRPKREFMVDIDGTQTTVRVHDGFHDQAEFIYPVIKKAIDEYLTEVPKEKWEVLITGHSLGGAVSTMTAFFVCRDYPVLRPVLTLIPHASPRVGDSSFKLAMESSVGRIIRTVFETDIVTRVPFEKFGFRHLDITLDLKKRTRKWYDRILHPLAENIGSAMDHYPQNYRDAINALPVIG